MDGVDALRAVPNGTCGAEPGGVLVNDAGGDGMRVFDFAANEPLADHAGMEGEDGVIYFGLCEILFGWLGAASLCVCWERWLWI